MAYNTWKGDAAVGDVVNQDDIDTLIDWDENTITLKTNNAARLVVDNSSVSGSGDLEFAGNTFLGGTLNVTGAVDAKANVTLGDAAGDVTTVTGRLTGSQGAYFNSRVGIGTATPSDELHISASTSAVVIESYESSIAQIIFKQAGSNYGRIQVGGGGAFNIENLAADEDTVFKVNDGGTTRTALTLDASAAEVVVNQGSDSLLDFRVEGDGQTHMLFVDGSADKVGIKNSAPTHELTIGGNVSGSGTLEAVGATTLGSTLNVSGAATMAGNLAPAVDNSINLGSASKRWANVYTGDLHLKNDKGDWTIVEEEEYLCVINNKTGKKYEMVLKEIEE